MKKKYSFLLSTLLVMTLIISACGNAGKNTGTNNPGEASPEATASEVKLADNQEISVNIASEPPTLNPGKASDSTSGTILRQTFEGLTRIGQDGHPENAVASKVEVSPDQKVYTFTIRDGAKWSNGDPVIAGDFEYAWKWVLDPANAADYAYQLYYIKGAEAANLGKGKVEDVGIKAVNDTTLEVTLANPTSFFLELTAFYTYLPVNSKIAAANKNWANDAGDQYTTNGPFHMTEWKHSDNLILEKSDTYWDKDNVKLTKINFSMINDFNTELSMFDNGELDWAGQPNGSLPVDAMQALKDQGTLHTQPIAGVYNYKFNTKVAPFDNKNIRKAFTYAINRQELIDNITQGEQLPAMALVPPTMFAENEKGYFADNDVAKAKEYLAEGLKEMGLKDASELPPITISYNTNESHQKIAQAIQDMWSKNLGVEVTLDNAEWAVYIEKLHAGDYQVGRMGWLGDFNDPVNFLELYRDADGGNNDTGWENPEFKKLLNDSASEADAAKRTEMLKQAEAIFIDDMPVLPIYFYTMNWVQNEKLKGVVISGLGDLTYKWAYIEA